MKHYAKLLRQIFIFSPKNFSIFEILSFFQISGQLHKLGIFDYIINSIFYYILNITYFKNLLWYKWKFSF